MSNPDQITSALRNHFEVDARWIAIATLSALADEGKIGHEVVAAAIKEFGIDPEKPDPVTM